MISADETPKLEPVVQKSSSPGLVQPEAPVEKLEATAPVPESCSAVEPEPPLPVSMTAPTALPISVANKSEHPSTRESSASSSSPSPSAGEHKPSFAPSQTPITDKLPLDVPRIVAASPVPAPALAAAPTPAPEALNGLADSGIDSANSAHEPSPLAPAALQPQASAPAYQEASSSETLPSDLRPELPVAAALTPMAPVAVVPVTLTSSPAPVLPVALPPGLPPLVQATTEADELNKSLDTKDLAPSVGAEAHGGITENKTEVQQQALAMKSPTTGTLSACFRQT